ncbi:hypothetical protein C8J57DRAFT_1302577 [Mycena rebaudengoi]|nr:hypothetical protein C8J57DRAFT_1407116 [Mycena rebaudengoi]KAJ7280424.1 hypothetical protein C8J57DRAFT_1302577 [Mycena rebaudengoi]
MVRQGPVRIKEGRLRTAALKWVVLTESTLALYKSQGPGQRPRVVISLRDVTSVERTEDNHHDLILEIRGSKRYLLKFENDNELYDWKDDISRYSVASNVTYLTSSFVHRVHVGFDHVSGKYTGLPQAWAHIVEQPPPYKRAYQQVPQANIPIDVKSDYQPTRAEQLGSNRPLEGRGELSPSWRKSLQGAGFSGDEITAIEARRRENPVVEYGTAL